MCSPAAGKRRMDMDVAKLVNSKHDVTILSGLNEFVVKFIGPSGTPYEGGVWKIRVDLPESYPFKSPSIGKGSLLISTASHVFFPVCILWGHYACICT
jgi:ubiquitin-conjugating enzyme E2 H